MLYNVVDRVYIGHMPENGVAALTGLGLCFPIIMLISAFAALFGMGGAPLAAIAMGQGNHRRAEQILGNCTTALILTSAVLTVFFLFFGRPLLLLFGASTGTIGYAWHYLQIYVCGTVFVQIALGLNLFITTQGFATKAMITVLIGAILNTILDPVFIFVFGMGVQGAAAATVLSFTGSLRHMGAAFSDRSENDAENLRFAAAPSSGYPAARPCARSRPVHYAGNGKPPEHLL